MSHDQMVTRFGGVGLTGRSTEDDEENRPQIFEVGLGAGRKVVRGTYNIALAHRNRPRKVGAGCVRER